MAITKILKMQTDSHVTNAIKYAVENKVNPENENEVSQTYSTYINTVSNTTATNISKSWKDIRQHFETDNGNLAYQIVQNFGEGINPELANEIGVKFAKELLGNRQIIVSTHTNTEYIHNHIIFNSPDMITGEKYNDCYDTYFNGIRKISDRLCDEYGLKVLEDTRNGTLVFYKDKEGKTRAFEPTKRKSESEHFDSRYAQADVWNNDMHRRKNRVSKIVTDMETVIPISNDFEDFLQKMRNMGYRIKAKTSTGDWRQHITYFEPDKPENSKGIRDSNKLLAGYTRTEIEDKIKKFRDLNHEQEQEESFIFSEQQSIDDLSESISEPFETQEVKYNDVDEISIDERKDTSKRSLVDKYLAQDIKILRKSVDDEFYSSFKRSPSILPRNDKERKNYDVIKRINAKVRTLNFMETYKTYAPSELENRMKRFFAKRDETAKVLDSMRSELNVMNNYAAIIEKANSIKKHIEAQTLMYGKSYTESEGQTEIQTYNDFVDKLKSVGLEQQEQQVSYIEKVKSYRAEYSQLATQLQKISNCLYQCDDIYRIMKECGLDSTEELKRYEEFRFAHSRKNKEREKLNESQRAEK